MSQRLPTCWPSAARARPQRREELAPSRGHGWPSSRVGALALALVAAFAPDAASAYDVETRFDAPAIEGGAGGRAFTGAPADGYTCAVCHRGGGEPAVGIRGIPAEGWTPGETYELHVLLPTGEGARRVGAAIEIADEAGSAAGRLALVPDAELEPMDRCSVGTAEDATELVPRPGRLVARTRVCGASRARVRWTAPDAPSNGLRLFVTVVGANGDGEPDGDGTAVIAMPLRALGSPEVTGASFAQRCSVGPARAHGIFVVVTASLLAAQTRGRRRRASKRV